LKQANNHIIFCTTVASLYIHSKVRSQATGPDALQQNIKDPLYNVYHNKGYNCVTFCVNNEERVLWLKSKCPRTNEQRIYYKKKSPYKQFDCTSFNNMTNKVAFLSAKWPYRIMGKPQSLVHTYLGQNLAPI